MSFSLGCTWQTRSAVSGVLVQFSSMDFSVCLYDMQDAEDESQMPKAWKMDAGEEPVNTQMPRL